MLAKKQKLRKIVSLQQTYSMSLEFAAGELQLDEKNREDLIARTDELINYFNSDKCELKKTKIYQKVCTEKIYDIEGSKINGVYGEVILKGKTLDEVCKIMLQCAGDIDEKSPKQLLKMMLFQKLYFWSLESKKAYEDVIAGKEIKDFEFFTHGCGRSPSPALVKHRDYIAIGRLLKKENTVYLLRTSVPSDANMLKNVVRSNLYINCFAAEQLEDGSIKLSNTVHVDPCGSVPGPIVNLGLNMTLEVLMLAYNVILGKEKFQYN